MLWWKSFGDKRPFKKKSAFHSKNLSEVEFCFGGPENSDRNLFKMAAAETDSDSDAGIRPPTCPVRFFSLKSVDWLPVIHPQLFAEHFDGCETKKRIGVELVVAENSSNPRVWKPKPCCCSGLFFFSLGKSCCFNGRELVWQFHSYIVLTTARVFWYIYTQLLLFI